jgi:hypothetical protein
MVHLTLFEKLFEVDLRSPDGPARWWFIDEWVDHTLTNEQVLFDPGAEVVPDCTMEEVEALQRVRVGDPVLSLQTRGPARTRARSRPARVHRPMWR